MEITFISCWKTCNKKNWSVNLIRIGRLVYSHYSDQWLTILNFSINLRIIKKDIQH
jgi:hypothetical protein